MFIFDKYNKMFIKYKNFIIFKVKILYIFNLNKKIYINIFEITKHLPWSFFFFIIITV